MKDKSIGFTNVNENDNLVSGEIRKGEELRKNIEIPGTPFVGKWVDGIGYFAVCGKYRLTEPFETEGELMEHVERKPWDMIITLVNIVNLEGKKLMDELLEITE